MAADLWTLCVSRHRCGIYSASRADCIFRGAIATTAGLLPGAITLIYELQRTCPELHCQVQEHSLPQALRQCKKLHSFKLKPFVSGTLSFCLLFGTATIQFTLRYSQAVQKYVFAKYVMPGVLEYEADSVCLPCPSLILLPLECLLMDILQTLEIEAAGPGLYPGRCGKKFR